jgi:hypothetical protein
MKELSTVLTQARSIIEQRFVKPYKDRINVMCGGERIQPIDLKVEWNSVEAIVNRDIDEAENAIQTLQMSLLWENLKKGVMRFIAEDAFQRELFNETVTSIGKLILFNT